MRSNPRKPRPASGKGPPKTPAVIGPAAPGPGFHSGLVALPGQTRVSRRPGMSVIIRITSGGGGLRGLWGHPCSAPIPGDFSGQGTTAHGEHRNLLATSSFDNNLCVCFRSAAQLLISSISVEVRPEESPRQTHTDDTARFPSRSPPTGGRHSIPHHVLLNAPSLQRHQHQHRAGWIRLLSRCRGVRPYLHAPGP